MSVVVGMGTGLFEAMARGRKIFRKLFWEWEDGFCMGRFGGEGAVLCPARLDILMVSVVLFECGQGVVRDTLPANNETSRSERSLNVGAMWFEKA
jgi:hypothetical protein